MKIIIIVLLTTLSGCTTINRAIQWGAAANDTALESAKEMKCNVASIRAVREAYNTPELIKAYNLECGKTLAEK